MNTPNTQIALINQSLKHITEKVDKIDKSMEKNYVTKAEFDPVKKVAFGSIAVSVTLLVSLVYFLLTQKNG